MVAVGAETFAPAARTLATSPLTAPGSPAAACAAELIAVLRDDALLPNVRAFRAVPEMPEFARRSSELAPLALDAISPAELAASLMLPAPSSALAAISLVAVAVASAWVLALSIPAWVSARAADRAAAVFGSRLPVTSSP